MAANVAPHVGRETTLDSLGQTWTLSVWTLRVWDDFLTWARTVLPDPLDEAEKSCLRLARQERPVRARLAAAAGPEREALEADLNDLMVLQTRIVELGTQASRRYLSVDSPEVQSLLSSPRGTARLLRLLLAAHHPGIDDDGAFAVQQGADAAQLREALVVVAGKTPPQGNGVARPV